MSSLLFILLLFCFISYIKEKNFLNPQFIFNFIWCVTLNLYELKLSYIQQDLSDRTVLIFWLCILSYNFAFILLALIKFPGLKRKIKIKNYKKRRKIAKRLVISIFILEVLYSGGVPFIWILIGSSKTYFDFGISSLHGAWCGLIVCLGAYSLLKKSKEKWLYLILCAVLISRQLIMSIVIEGFIYAFYMRNIKVKFESINRRKKIKTKFIITILITVIFSFTIIGNFRSGNKVMNSVFQARENVKLSSTSMWLYSYMTFSISNFNNLVRMTQGGVNNGASMLREFLPTVLQRIFRIKPNYSSYYLVARNYTVSTYLPSVYLDFGMFGICVFNFIIGFAGYILYKNIKNHKTSRGVMLYAVYAHNILMLFFVNFFLFLPIIFQMFYIPLLFSNKTRKEKSICAKCFL